MSKMRRTAVRPRSHPIQIVSESEGETETDFNADSNANSDANSDSDGVIDLDTDSEAPPAPRDARSLVRSHAQVFSPEVRHLTHHVTEIMVANTGPCRGPL